MLSEFVWLYNYYYIFFLSTYITLANRAPNFPRPHRTVPLFPLSIPTSLHFQILDLLSRISDFFEHILRYTTLLHLLLYYLLFSRFCSHISFPYNRLSIVWCIFIWVSINWRPSALSAFNWYKNLVGSSYFA